MARMKTRPDHNLGHHEQQQRGGGEQDGDDPLQGGNRDRDDEDEDTNDGMHTRMAGPHPPLPCILHGSVVFFPLCFLILSLPSLPCVLHGQGDFFALFVFN